MTECTKQQWRKIQGFEAYSVSDYGQVRNDKTGRILSLTNTRGYLQIGLRCGKVSTKFRVHRLVAQAFLPAIEGKEHVDHINEVKDDNRLCNLRWCTPRENTQFYIANHPATPIIPKERIKESAEAKELRVNVVRKTYGTSVVVDGIQFDAVRQAAKYIHTNESSRGSEETIRKEIKQVVKGTRKPFVMYSRFTIGY